MTGHTVADASPLRRKIGFIAVITALSVSLLLITEIWALVVSAAWAFGGLLRLGEIGYLGFGGVVAIPAAWASWEVVRRSFRTETTYPDEASLT